MEIQLKERLVGAIVLVVLAVIFIPVLISGPSSKDSQDRESVPVPLPGTQQAREDAAKPPAQSEQSYSYDLSKPDTPLVQAPSRDTESQPEATSEQTSDAPSGNASTPQANQTAPSAAKQKPASTAAAGDKESKQSADSSVAVQEEPPPAKPAPKSVSTASRTPESGASKPAAGAEEGHWAVQAGSFSERSRADSVAKDLKAKGFAAFVMPVEVHGKDYFRVRVGPQATREAAENVAAKLRKQYKGPAQVVTHP